MRMIQVARLITLYGISNCDSVRRAKKFLTGRGANFHFHDFRKDGLAARQVQDWLQRIDAEQLINKRSTSWKNLSTQEREVLGDPAINKSGSKQQQAAIAILVAQPTLVKRPLVQFEHGQLVAGFAEQSYIDLLAAEPV